jgi:hypothetical protein
MNSKMLVFCCIFTYFSLPLCAHACIKADSLFRTPAQNRHWLATLKQHALANQWAQIQTRYFEAQEANLPIGPVTALPMLVVEGLVVEQTSTDKRIWDLVTTQLTAARVKTIDVIEHEPSGLYVNKALLAGLSSPWPIEHYVKPYSASVDIPNRTNELFTCCKPPWLLHNSGRRL